MDVIQTNNQIQGNPVYIVTGPQSQLPCMGSGSVVNDATYDCTKTGCVDPGTGNGQYPDYLSCFNDCGGEEPSARFDAKICGCSDSNAPSGYSCDQILGNTMPTPGSFTIDNQTPLVGDYMTSHCVGGLATYWPCTWEVTNIVAYSQPSPSYNRPSADHCLCENGMITPGSSNWGYCEECFTGSPNPPITGNNCECCSKEEEETKHCTCCSEVEVGGISQNTSIPIGDSCSQFNNSQPGLYGCEDSTVWNINSCKDVPVAQTKEKVTPERNNLKEEITRIKKLMK
tara:strand:- start:95 stop:949 length:855 start_codon:yes stop_codon:yes gene_type:complete